MTTLATLNLASLASLYNTAVLDYAPEGFGEVAKFASKAKGVAAIEAMCAAGNLAVAFDGDTAMIVDAMESAVVIGADGEGYGANDDDEADKEALAGEGGEGEGEADEADEGEGEGEGDEADEVPALVTGGADGKGKPRAWGFATASAEWLANNPRGGEAREAYRTERRKAARMARKADRKAKEALQAGAAE